MKFKFRASAPDIQRTRSYTRRSVTQTHQVSPLAISISRTVNTGIELQIEWILSVHRGFNKVRHYTNHGLLITLSVF